MCPGIVRLLYYMYTHKQYYVKWNIEHSNLFNVSNGVKQGRVISPLLISIYIDELFSKLEYLGLGCHIGLTYARAFDYADDIALISPMIYGLKNMPKVIELFAVDYHLTFNPIKSKLICYNIDSCCCCCCLPTPMALASGGSQMFPLVVHQPAYLASSAVTPAGSVHKSRGDNEVRMLVQLKR